MRYNTFFALVLASNIAASATPIEGWYSSVFGGYAYVPNFVNTTKNGIRVNNVSNFSGFDAGGNLGFKSTPMRYEGEVSYINTKVNAFNLNSVPQTTPRGNNYAVLGMANFFYDLPSATNLLQPFLGVGIGYAWVETQLKSSGPLLISNFTGANSAFAYQGQAGITYNFSENYALTLNYRYVATTNIPELGNMFQAHLANAGATYRFDGNNYK